MKAEELKSNRIYIWYNKTTYDVYVYFFKINKINIEKRKIKFSQIKVRINKKEIKTINRNLSFETWNSPRWIGFYQKSIPLNDSENIKDIIRELFK